MRSKQEIQEPTASTKEWEEFAKQLKKDLENSHEVSIKVGNAELIVAYNEEEYRAKLADTKNKYDGETVETKLIVGVIVPMTVDNISH